MNTKLLAAVLTLGCAITNNVYAINYIVSCINNTSRPVMVWVDSTIRQTTFAVEAFSKGYIGTKASCPAVVRVSYVDGDLIREFKYKGQACGNKNITVDYDKATGIAYAVSDTPEGIIGSYRN